ncbi:carbon monoxide dehydrogenase subunit G [Geminicoccaceae bacterium 1502E]|nr:carbon monoxide dehydrogenase subunit G [Geminicoccaceae bacterium 1502E]
MDMTGEYRIPAPRQRVWEALNDPEILRQSIPGCQSLEKTSENELTAKVKAKVGPVAATFNGKVTLGDLNPPESYTISGEGSGGVAGFAKGGANVHLTEDGPETTILRYDAKADVGGKLAQIGSRLIQGTAKKMADDFFGKFSTIVGGPAEAPAPAAAEPAAAPAPEPAAAAAAPPASPAMAAPAGAMPTPPPTAAAQPPLRPGPEEPQPRPIPPQAPAAAPAGGLANNPLVWVGVILLIVLVLFLILS